jgi:hypothetical protein
MAVKPDSNVEALKHVPPLVVRATSLSGPRA